MDRQLLARATDSSDAPTPGYMYNDIAKNAASNPGVCSDVAKYLTGRLASKNNHNVKYKCLKVIGKTASSPYLRGQFKRALSQDPNAMAAIKDAVQFRGPPDPVRGDQPYERVRVAAKEALDAIYSDTPAEQSSGGSFATSVSSTSSYGPSPHHHQSQPYGSPMGGAGGPGGSSRRMEGIGNPMFKDPRLEPQPGNGAAVGAVLSEAKDTIVGMIRDPLARNADVVISNRQGQVPGHGGYNAGSYNPSYPPGRSELMHQTNGEWTMKSNRGPGAVSAPPNFQNDSAYYKSRDTNSAYAWAQKSGPSAGGVGGSWAGASVASQARQPSYAEQHQTTPSITVTGGALPPTNISGSGGTAVADGSYEKQLIMELCPPGGMKAEPPPDKLNQFARTVSNLNPDLVCPVLLDCLEDGQPWIIRAKALCVMECCVKYGKKPEAPNNPYSDFFHACGGEIAPLANHTRSAIRDPAKRLLSLLGIATPVGGAAPPVPAARPPAAAPPPPVQNLLDFSNDEPTPAPAPQVQSSVPPAQASAPAGGASLFGGLNVAATNTAAPVPAAAPTAPPPAAPPAAPSSGNLLGDLMSGDEAPPAAAVDGSLFGNMDVKSNAPQSDTDNVKQASSMFENMSVKADEPKKEEAPASMPAGSAFGFINQPASNDTADNNNNKETQGAQPSPALPASWDTFDPLKNMTPNTSKQMMQMSPQQMQAMAYQQMMMQQQMQMAQMMAMQQQQQQQQQRGGSGAMFMPMPGAGGVPMRGQMVMQNPAAAKTSFAFLDGKAQSKDDKSFDFVKDAMKSENKK